MASMGEPTTAERRVTVSGPTDGVGLSAQDPALPRELLGTSIVAGTEDLAEMKTYVGWTAEDEDILVGLRPAAEAALPALLVDFYGAIARHPSAAKVFKSPETDIPRQQKMLSAWVLTLLEGPWDEAYAERRAAIGRAHVRHQLPQRYMLVAMNVIRRWFMRLLATRFADDQAQMMRAIDAVDRILDMELALMLGTYRDDLVLRMQRGERLATIGELAAGIQHELKNPLAAVSTALFALKERRPVIADPRSRELLTRAEDNVRRASEIITDLLSFARLRSPEVAPTTANRLVEVALQRVRIPVRCRVVRDLDPALPPVQVDSAQIAQILVNLLENAFDACPEAGEIRLATRLVDGRVEISIHDNGVGIPHGDLERVFEALYSTKPEGVGLGLSLSRHLARANQGSIGIDSQAGRGTVVTLVLPAH